MGSVYEAEHLSLRRRVALKVLDPALTRQPDFVERFHREVETIAHLEHPNILPVYDTGEDDGLLYLVMLLVRGGTLKDRLHLEPPPWPARQVLKLAQQVLTALDAAHQQGIIHRDIKPDNILLHGDRALLADFGIAKLMQGDPGLTVVGTFMGTPDYAAPEQVLALPLDGRSDLYAFGVVLYELLVGRVPYRADTPMGVALQHVQGPLPPPLANNPDLPPQVAQVLVKALARERDDRYASGPEFAEALERAIAAADGGVARATTVVDAPLPYVHPAASPTVSPDVHADATVIDPELRQAAEQRERQRVEAEAAATRERERLETEVRERERVAAEQRERQRLEAEARERERLEAEARERERLEAEAAATRERERVAAETRERERLATEQRERERQEAERRERERVAAEAAALKERERQEAEQRKRERRDAEEQRKLERAAEAEQRKRERAAARAAAPAAPPIQLGGRVLI